MPDFIRKGETKGGRLIALIGTGIWLIVTSWLIARGLSNTAIPIEPSTLFEQRNVYLVSDGIVCWFDTYPIIEYSAQTQNVKLLVNCDPDILFHYLPAEE